MDATIARAPEALTAGSLTFSPLAWGMWRFAGQEPARARALVEAAFEAGITLFDTADIYGFGGEGFGAAEALLGRVFRESPGLRDRMVLASKGGICPPVPYDSSAAYLTAACEASLARLGVDHLDLYQIHRPDLLAHPAEVAGALEALRTAGKIREVGVSNYTAAQTAALQAHLSFPLVTHQPEFSPLATTPIEDGILDQALERGMRVLAWSPLGGGRLGGPSEDPRVQRVQAALDRVAEREGVSRTALAYAWIMAHPTRAVPIVGSQDPARIREASDALKVRLDRTEWYAILVASRGVPMP